jgi:hypothetical protein
MNEHLKAGYGEGSASNDGQKLRLRSIAGLFRENPDFERLLAMSPEEFTATKPSPNMRLQLAYYQEAKSAAERMSQ